MSDSLNYIQLLQQPEFISKTDVQLFHNWVNDYPFVPVYRVLLAAKYQSLNHSDTAQYIEQAAFYVQDRKQLKSLLRKWSNLQVEPEIITSDVEIIVEEEKLTPEEIEAIDVLINVEQTEKVDNTTKETIEELSQEVDAIDSNTEVIIENQVVEEIKSIDIEEDSSVAFISEENECISEKDDIEFLKAIGKYEIPFIQAEVDKADWILDAPGNIIPTISENDIIDAGFVNTDISYLLPWINEFEFNFIRQEIKIVAPTEITSPTIAIDPTPINTEEKAILPETLPTKETVVEGKAVSIEEKIAASNHSFDEWLSILEQKKNAEEDAPVFDLPSPEVFTKNELSQEKADPIITYSPIEKKDSKEETEDVKQQAADSISFKNDMGTETLAKLYVLQGKTELAISIYQKLMMKFPEKNSYFASQIKKIKK